MGRVVERKSDTLNAKVKGKSQPSEAGSGERLKKINKSRLSGGA